MEIKVPYVERRIHICPTGVFMPGEPGEHIGTVRMADGLVFHIFDCCENIPERGTER